MHPTEQQDPTNAPRHRRGRVSRRDAIATLGGLGTAGLAVLVIGPGSALLAGPDRRFPSWVYTMPRGGEAYAAALAHPDLLATLPCFCGCMRFEQQPHDSLRTCFMQPSGELDPHGAFCETCQDEALDAAAWSREGVAWDEIHARIVAKYQDRDPISGGIGCGGGEHGAGAACAP